MSTDLVTNPNPEPIVTANPTEPVKNGAEPVKTDSQADGGKTPISEDTFFTGDVKTLPPQLRQAYDNMLRDYKSKTEKVANERKELESIKEKADFYDQISNDEEFVKYWNNLTNNEKKELTKANSSLDVSDEEFAKAFESREGFMQLFKKLVEKENVGVQQKLEEAAFKIRQTETSQVVDAFSEATDDKGQLLYPNFKKLENILVHGKTSLFGVFAGLDPAKTVNSQQLMQKLERAYHNAEKFYNSLIEEGKKIQMDTLQKKVGRGSEEPTITGSQNVFTGDPTKITVKEAWRLAKQGITVSR